MLSSNPKAIHLLEQNLDNINWSMLSNNPNAIPLLEKNLDKIDWSRLSENPNAMSLLEKNQRHICCMLSTNPNIFEPDYQEMSKDRTKIIYQELMEKAWHPLRIIKWIEVDFDF
jgi:hypothetical protein